MKIHAFICKINERLVTDVHDILKKEVLIKCCMLIGTLLLLIQTCKKIINLYLINKLKNELKALSDKINKDTYLKAAKEYMSTLRQLNDIDTHVFETEYSLEVKKDSIEKLSKINDNLKEIKYLKAEISFLESKMRSIDTTSRSRF